MSYWVGELAEFGWEVEVNEQDEEPTTFVVTLTLPDGSTEPITPENPSPGVYTGQWDIEEAGHYQWVALSTGDAQAAAVGVFDAFATTPQTEPLTGIAAPWIDAAALNRQPAIVAYNAENPDAPIPPFILDAAARFASEVLWALSGRQFSGIARTHVRPVARPEGWDVRSWGASLGFNYWNSWGQSYAMGYGAATAPVQGYRAPMVYPHEIELNYPIQRIEQVKVDGTVIPGPTAPAPEYQVFDRRFLVRTKPTADSQPTARGDWPHWQALWLLDDQPNTFSVTYWYGVGPPQSGITACEVFATEIALDMVGADNRLPARIREISRQGETAMVVDSLEALTHGWTGIPICDYFIGSLNPNKLQRRGAVWTPDMGRVRTPTTGT